MLTGENLISICAKTRATFRQLSDDKYAIFFMEVYLNVYFFSGASGPIPRGLKIKLHSVNPGYQHFKQEKTSTILKIYRRTILTKDSVIENYLTS